MPYYRRYFVPGALVFITNVTFNRIPHFHNAACLNLLWETMRGVQELHPFHLLAYVILPDHFHWVMQTPEDQPNFAVVMKSIKWNYVRNYRNTLGNGLPVRIWQERYWDHIIRDEKDLANHFDYIHWNPVKHGWVKEPGLWEQSSFRHWLEKGYYGSGWGHVEEPQSVRGMSFE